MIADSLGVSRSVPAVLDVANLVAGDNSADDRSLPVIVRGNQSPSAIVQFQCRIGQCIGNAILSQSSGPIARTITVFWFESLEQ